jgi:hypothetical protein
VISAISSSCALPIRSAPQEEQVAFRPPRFIPLCASTSADRFQHGIARLAWELGGYEDIDASARFHRDLLRRIGPAVVDKAVSCAA